MVNYKDILNSFGGESHYADQFQAAALRGDSTGMADAARAYREVQQPEYTPQRNLGNWDYQDDSADRQEEILNHLDEAYAQNPDQFKDWATFSQNFNYDTAGRSDKQKETMRNWYSQTQQNNIDYNDANNTDYFFNQLMGGGQISGEGAALDVARNRYKNYQYLSGMTPDQIASAIASNSINPVGQEMQDLKNYSPALYAQVQSAMQGQTQVNDINALGEGIYNGLTNTETNKNYTNYNFTTEYAKNASVIKQYNESLYKKIEGLGGDTAAYVAIVASMLQNPLIQANKDEVENLEGEIRKIQENIYTVGDSARSRLGSEAPEDLVSAYISQQTKDLQNQLRTAQNSLLVAQGKLNNQLTEVETMIDAINNGIKMQASGMLGTPTEVIDMGGGDSGGSNSIGAYKPNPTPQDTYNYQDDSDYRLKEIADNLKSLYNSNPELFKDRATFDNYFKYNQRSPKQKAVLDAFFIQKKGLAANIKGKLRLGGVQTEQEEDGLINAIKKDLLANKVVSFDATSMKKTYGKYGVLSRGQDASHNAIQQIGGISSWDEVSKMMTHLDDALDKALLDGFWGNESHKTALVNNIKKIGNGSTSEQQQKISDYLSQFKLDEASWRKFLSDAGIKEKNINKIIAL